MFNQSMYSVNEDAGPAQPVLVINNQLSTDITVQVTNTDRSATGEYRNILINSIIMLFARYLPAIFQPPSVDGGCFGRCTRLLITD